MARIERRENDWLGISLAAAGGLAAGVMLGLVVGEMLGDLHPERVRGALRRLRAREGADPSLLEQEIVVVLQGDPELQDLGLAVRALGDGMVELSGTVPAAELVERARRVTRTVRGVDIVVNHLLVEGVDVPARDASAH